MPLYLKTKVELLEELMFWNVLPLVENDNDEEEYVQHRIGKTLEVVYDL